MTGEQIGGVVRAIATAVVGFAAGKGWIGSDQVAGIVTALATLAVAAWSVFSKKQTA